MFSSNKVRRLLKKLFFRSAFSILLLTTDSLAAPCCGGSSALPSLITGDDRAQVSASLTQSQVIGDAPSQGLPVFRGEGDNESSQTLRFDGAYRFADADAWQAGLGVPLTRRSREFGPRQTDRAGLGDLTADVAYEILPELSYSAWKPKGFVFVDLTAPTSPSIYDAKAPYLVDARGRGFFSLGAGLVFIKTVQSFDFNFISELHRSFARSFELQDGSHITAEPGWGGSLTLGGGYNLENFRFGLSLSPVYEDPITTSGDLNSKSSSQLVWNTTAQVGYLISTEWSASFNYTDQTLMGPVRNVTLSRSFSLLCQRRWEL